MSIAWNPTTLAVVDDADDRDRASDGVSRFGVYLRQHAADLRDCDAPLDTDEFAAAVWRIAGSPVMAPGYVRLRPDVHAITPTWSEDGAAGLMFDVRLRLPRTALLAGRTAVPAGWSDWRTERHWEDGDRYRWWSEPASTRPALLTTTVIRLPVDATWTLPSPRTAEGPRLVTDAKRSVAAVAAAVNRLAGPVVATLRGERS